jgi:hypothetical protein
LLTERLFSNPGGFDIQGLYMDDGWGGCGERQYWFGDPD